MTGSRNSRRGSKKGTRSNRGSSPRGNRKKYNGNSARPYCCSRCNSHISNMCNKIADKKINQHKLNKIQLCKNLQDYDIDVKK